MLCLLGPPAVLQDGRLEPLRLRPKAFALLAYLALRDGSQPRGELAELLFPDAADPRDSLRWHLSHLRARLPDSLRSRIRADRGAVELDVPTDVRALDDGDLSVYRGDFCAGLSVSASADFHNWLYVEDDRARQRLRQGTVQLARRSPAAAIVPLECLIRSDPYFEDGHVLLVGAYEAAGREDEARHAYDRYQRIVRTELHARPRSSVAARYELDPPDGRSLPLEDLIPLRDISMHIVEWPGADPPVLAIHGSAGNAYVLTALGERLAPDVRVIAVDLRGHGFSDKPPRGYAVADHVSDLRQLARALGLEQPVLLGHSVGGAIATFAAEAISAAGVILLDAVVGDRAFTQNAAAQAIGALGPGLDRRYAGFQEYLERWQLDGREPQTDVERWIDRSARYALAPSSDGSYRMRGLRQALEAEWESVTEADSLGALRRLTCPVLVVQAPEPWIAGLPYLPDAAIRAQVAAARHATVHVAVGSHHGEVVRDPDAALVGAIKQFVRSLGSSSAAR